MLALVAFASNSVLCRFALRDGSIDPASFTTIRVASGAAMLLLVSAWATETATASDDRPGSWTSAFILCLYAVPFSLAYTQLSAGSGALILFGSVQVTMWLAAWRAGEPMHPKQWLGLTVAVSGLVYLVLPGVTAPPIVGAVLMSVAGYGWGTYSLRGRGTMNALSLTAMNFIRTLPLVVMVSIAMLSQFHITARGALLAAASGALASVLGYVVWYAALAGLTAVRAAIVQLAVPVIAAVGGVIFLAETVAARLVSSSIMIIGGIVLTILDRRT
jgi:drug/metabolite transporter (DMT)-like permease